MTRNKLTRIFTTLITLLFVIGQTLSAQAIKTSLEEEHLQGKVRSTVDVVYAASGTEDNITKKEKNGTFTKVFDRKGNMTEDSFSEKFLDSKNSKTYAYSYDKDDNILTITAYESGNDWYKHSYEYDKKGNRTKNKTEYGYGEGNYELYVYDDKQKMIEKTDYYYRPSSKTYDKKIQTFKYTYDSKGNLVEKIEYRGDRESQKNQYKYDAAGNQIEDLTYYSKESVVKYTTKYDSKKNLIEKTEYKEGRNDEKIRQTFTYDAKGNIIEEYLYFDGSDNPSYITKKQYDSRNNWTKQILLYYNNTLKSITERTIEYY